ncbi:MAG: redoxin domain-containing protein [Verrucomicrobiales bacterium]|nr:redoxin domain-containing protein [Verrucomicrobiales bacterium]
MIKKYPLLLTVAILAISTFNVAADDKASVYLFVIPDCPIVNRYAPEINRIYEDYSGKGVKITLVYAEPSLTSADIEKHRKEYSLKPPGVLDPGWKITRRSGATITPEAVVYDAGEKIVYRGRIDDWFTDFGDSRREASEKNLRLALDAVLAGKEVEIKEAEAVGCYIEYD